MKEYYTSLVMLAKNTDDLFDIFNIWRMGEKHYKDLILDDPELVKMKNEYEEACRTRKKGVETELEESMKEHYTQVHNLLFKNI